MIATAQANVLKLFLSTPSSRRATTGYPHHDADSRISIHALLAEGDLCRLLASSELFVISIHALLAEGDQTV